MQNKVKAKYQILDSKINLNQILLFVSLASNLDQLDNLKLRNDLEFAENEEKALASNKMIIVKRSLANFLLKQNNIDFQFCKHRHVAFIVTNNIAVACRAIAKNADNISIQAILVNRQVRTYTNYNTLALIPGNNLATLDNLQMRQKAYALFYLSIFIKCYIKIVDVLTQFHTNKLLKNTVATE